MIRVSTCVGFCSQSWINTVAVKSHRTQFPPHPPADSGQSCPSMSPRSMSQHIHRAVLKPGASPFVKKIHVSLELRMLLSFLQGELAT